MEQSRLGSLIESCINTGIGFIVSLTLAMLVYPMFGHSFTLGQNIWITAIFTVSSILRSYAVRRWANDRIKKTAARLAAKGSD